MADSDAFGRPGAVPYWDHADKDGVGSGYSPANRVWFTLWRGALSEIYYPRVDSAQLRKLQLVITDGRSFVNAESVEFHCEVSRLNQTSLAYLVTGRARDCDFEFEKRVICDPDLPCVLQHYRFRSAHPNLSLYIVCNPHPEDQGITSQARVIDWSNTKFLVGNKKEHWMALGATPGFSRASVGFAGASDGLTDLRDNYRLDFEFNHAAHGNIVLTGELPHGAREAVVGIAFGDAEHGAITALVQAFASNFDDKLKRYLDQWQTGTKGLKQLEGSSGDRGRVYHISCNTLCSHEDRIYPGAFIASLAVPWGEVKKALTPSHAGYHLVWPRDAVNAAGALLASGDRDTPLRTLTYLAVSQRPDGSFAQNFWIDGSPNWTGLQLDEVTYPVLLARKLHGEGALLDFDPRPMVYKAAEYIVDRGPITPQERWEQMSGYSPSTLAIVIASLLCAAAFAREDGKLRAAEFLEQYADWLRDHIEPWTVTTCGELLPDVRRYIIRLTPAHPGEASPVSPNDAMLKIPDQRPGDPSQFPARNIVDAGFLEFVRYGVLAPHDPLIVDSLRVVDAVLKVDTPAGACWRRFNHDGYGQRDDGSPYKDWGRGRAWPLLTGERGHYALRAGHDVRPYIRAMEGLAGSTGLIPEQVWDQPFCRDGKDYFGRPTGSANPLAWAHAEYIKLIRSAADGRVFDLPSEVEERYARARGRLNRLAMWTPHYPLRFAAAGETLRIYAREAFLLRYSLDNWSTTTDVDATDTELAIHFTDIPLAPSQQAPVRFTFFWKQSGSWQGYDFAVAITPPANGHRPAY